MARNILEKWARKQLKNNDPFKAFKPKRRRSTSSIFKPKRTGRRSKSPGCAFFLITAVLILAAAGII